MDEFIRANSCTRIKTPPQTNSNDCGVYTIKYAKNFLECWPSIRNVETTEAYEAAFKWITPVEIEKERAVLIRLFEEKLKHKLNTETIDLVQL